MLERFATLEPNLPGQIENFQRAYPDFPGNFFRTRAGQTFDGRPIFLWIACRDLLRAAFHTHFIPFEKQPPLRRNDHPRVINPYLNRLLGISTKEYSCKRRVTKRDPVVQQLKRLDLNPFRETIRGLEKAIWRVRVCKYCRLPLIARKPAQVAHRLCRPDRRKKTKLSWWHMNSKRLNKARRLVYRTKKHGNVRSYGRTKQVTQVTQ
jgi:hypothetical protein